VSYTELATVAVAAAVLADLFIWRTRLVARRIFWYSYAIIVFFQLLTNGMFTGWQIVKYRGWAIMGSDSPTSAAPPFLGDGRVAFAPVEDLLFGFALVLLSLCGWVWLGRRGVQRDPRSGPPIWRR
jgi:hypothetical protein